MCSCSSARGPSPASDDGAFLLQTGVQAAKDNLPPVSHSGDMMRAVLLARRTTISISPSKSITRRTHCSLDRFTSSVPESVVCSVLHVKRFRSKVTSCWMRASRPGKGPTPLCRSMLHYFFDRYGVGECSFHLHANNYSGQNKHSCMMHYLM